MPGFAPLASRLLVWGPPVIGPTATFIILSLLWSALSLACATSGRAPSSSPATPPIESGEEPFTSGSAGVESEERIPFWTWQVLPRVFGSPCDH